MEQNVSFFLEVSLHHDLESLQEVILIDRPCLLLVEFCEKELSDQPVRVEEHLERIPHHDWVLPTFRQIDVHLLKQFLFQFGDWIDCDIHFGTFASVFFSLLSTRSLWLDQETHAPIMIIWLVKCRCATYELFISSRGPLGLALALHLRSEPSCTCFFSILFLISSFMFFKNWFSS